MTDRELKKSLKKLGIILCLIVVLVILLLIYTLGNRKADLSIYANAEYRDNLQVLGMDEKEFKEYLSLFGYLVDSQCKDENQRVLNMATNFMENMCSSYEPQTNEQGMLIYDADTIHQIIKEIEGTYLKTSLKVEEGYTYLPENNTYVQNQAMDRMTNCTQIKEIQKKGDEIEVTYEWMILTKEQMAEFKTGQKSDFETHTIQAIILNNPEYEYSKYFVSKIEEI